MKNELSSLILYQEALSLFAQKHHAHQYAHAIGGHDTDWS
jgi:hypothetical protein